MNADQIVGERIHLLMRRQGMTQTEMGEALDINQSSMSKKLYGRRTWTIDEVLAAARCLNVEVGDLLPGRDYAPVLEGRGRIGGDVRPKRLELPTFWFVARRRTDWDAALVALVESSARLTNHTDGSQ